MLQPTSRFSKDTEPFLNESSGSLETGPHLHNSYSIDYRFHFQESGLGFKSGKLMILESWFAKLFQDSDGASS